MGRKPRNRNTDAVLMFWMQLSAQDQLECVIDMMRHLAGIVASMPDPPRTKKSKKGGQSEQPPVQSMTVG